MIKDQLIQDSVFIKSCASLEEFEQEFKAKALDSKNEVKNHLLILTQEDCQYCHEALKDLKKVSQRDELKIKVKFYEICLSKIDLVQSEKIKETLSLTGVPAFLFIDSKRRKKIKTGYGGWEELKNWMSV